MGRVIKKTLFQEGVRGPECFYILRLILLQSGLAEGTHERWWIREKLMPLERAGLLETLSFGMAHG